MTLSITETLEMLRNGHLKIFEPTYVRVGDLIFKVYEDREAKEESEQKPESEDKDRAVGANSGVGTYSTG